MTASTDVVLPADQSEGSTHQIGQWLKRVGDPVRRNEPLLEIITDKVTVEIAAPVDGVLAEILKEAGEEVEKGAVLGRIVLAPSGGRTAEFVPPRATVRPSAQPSDALELSPAVRRLIEEKGFDPAKIVGTGRGGRITVQDVEAHTPALRPSAPLPDSRIVPHSPMRKSIAEHMVRSVQTAPHVTAVFEADLSRVVAHREAQHGEKTKERITYTAYFVRATVTALAAVPEANSRWHPDGLELFADCNIGVAVALAAGGLIVPVLQRAQELDLAETARRIRDLTTRARSGRLEPREVQGGTFTISNHGVSGSLLAAPIVINQPQSAVLGVGKLEQRARVLPEGIAARPMLYVSLTIDHRVLDGFQANAFLSKWVEVIEQWS